MRQFKVYGITGQDYKLNRPLWCNEADENAIEVQRLFLPSIDPDCETALVTTVSGKKVLGRVTKRFFEIVFTPLPF